MATQPSSVKPLNLPPTRTTDTESTYTKQMYGRRAQTYDSSNDGWHVTLAQDFISWLSPLPSGGTLLDLACGTGLVTLPAAAALGPTGTVVGVDLTREMLNEGRRKHAELLGSPQGEDLAATSWHEHDITDPQLARAIPEIQHVLHTHGGFDAITCCSALVLLPSPDAAVRLWSALLKPGTGRIVVDVPTEDRTIMRLMTGPVREAVGKPMPYHDHRGWVQGVESLGQVYRRAGLEVEKSWRTRSYTAEQWYGEEEWEKAFERWTEIDQDPAWRDEKSGQQARKVFEGLFRENLRTRDNGELGFWDGHRLYVSIGRRQA